MWKYELPCGAFRTEVFKDEQGQWKFSPPVYEQRYMAVVNILQDTRFAGQFKKIVDFGCAELSLFSLLRNTPGISHILEVDIDEALLVQYSQRVKPFAMDWVNQRASPFRVEVLKGSVTTPAECLRGTDAVIAIELIEHLFAEELEKLPENIFGFIQPKLAIFTTPNAEANVLFDKLLPNGFRHADHKFEWTRAEFEKWATDVCVRYTNYSVAFLGIGLLPEEHKHLGHVSQAAIFVRNDLIGRELATPLNMQLPANTDASMEYKEIVAYDFPYRIDERTEDEKIRSEIKYQISRWRQLRTFDVEDSDHCCIPIKSLHPFLEQFNCENDNLRDILLDLNYKVEGNSIIVDKIENDWSDSMSEEDESYYVPSSNEECYSDEPWD